MTAIDQKKCDRLSIIGRWIVFCGVVLFGILGALWWKAYLAPSEHLILYFRQSVNGITIGSPVKVMGIEVGQVEGLGVYFPRESLGGRAPEKPQDYYYAAIQIVIKTDRLRARGLPDTFNNTTDLAAEIERGLRGMVALSSPMTGQHYIEISYAPDTPIRQVSSSRSGLTEIPTIDRGMTLFIDDAASKILKFAENDFAELEREWNATLDGVLQETRPENFAKINDDILHRLGRAKEILSDPAIQEECASINEKMKSLRSLLEDKGRPLVSKIADGQQLFNSIQQSFAKVNGQAAELEALLAFNSPEFKNVRLYLLKLRNIVTGLSGNMRLPTRQAIPNAPLNTGLSLSGQSEE